LGEAANEAGGRAFAVEYAKPSSTVAASFVVQQGQVDQLAQISEPNGYLNQLRNMGVAPTGQVLTLLRKYLPLPASLAAQGVTEAQYYRGYGYYTPSPAEPPFDAAGLTAELQTAYFTPMATLRPLFTEHGYLTRLATFISPDEMTRDPRFVTNHDLPDVEPNHLAVAHMLCGDQEYDVCHAPVRLHLEDGTDVSYAVAAGAPSVCDAQVTPTYDRALVDLLPSSVSGWMRDATGQGHQVVDNRAMIAAGISKQNASVQLGTGCSCSIRGRGRPFAAFVGVVALLMWRRRRRRV
jgi:hypothetical protein